MLVNWHFYVDCNQCWEKVCVGKRRKEKAGLSE
jgi:hypothetical protein